MVRFFLFSAAITGTTVFLTGAWFGSLAPLEQNSDTIFLPQNVQLDDDLVGSGINADQLLQKASEKLTSDAGGWLKTKIRQTMHGEKSRVRAEGSLQRGPNRCVRLEMAIIEGELRGDLLVVSDGDLLAQVRTSSDTPSAVNIEKLPPAADDGAASEKELLVNGCGGPLAHLRQLRARLKNATLQTGILRDNPVIQIKGIVDAADNPALARMKSKVVVGCAYLDARTLWPHRFEWRGDAGQVLQIDYLEGEIGAVLSDEECERVFSYEPSANEQITPGAPR